MTAPANAAALRAIPSVDRVLREVAEVALPRPLMVAFVRRELDAVRAEAAAGGSWEAGSIIQRVRERLHALARQRIGPVINGTGIIVHTNLGRSPLAEEAVTAIADVAAGYSSLEYDLTEGSRGGRGSYVEQQLAIVSEAEAATVVNNCAAALVLILRHFASPQRPAVVISRGELVQIGGGFRIPDILEASGATLREVGTTNHTTIDDYRRAIDDRTGLVLKVHRSNFYMAGFVESPSTQALSALARQRGVPLVEDLGSGATFPTESLGGEEREPTPAEVLRDGVDLVAFSGDKLLGGPQAGILAGSREHVSALKKNPLFRALRCDKLVLAGLQATLDLHLGDRADEVPILAMMRMPLEVLRERADRLVDRLDTLPLKVQVGEGLARMGGGSLPRTVLPSVTLEVAPTDGDAGGLAARLREGTPPVIACLGNGRVKIDLRTVLPRQDDALATALFAAAGGGA